MDPWEAPKADVSPDGDDGASEIMGRPAGVFVRAAAQLIDLLVLSPVIALSTYNTFYLKSWPVLFLSMIPGLLYKPVMEWKYAATLGKQALGLRVCDVGGGALSLGQAYTRFSPFVASSIISAAGSVWIFLQPEFRDAHGFVELAPMTAASPVTLFERLIGFALVLECLVALTNPEKRAGHDFMARSRVVHG